MSTKNQKTEQRNDNKVDQIQNEYNNLASVESVYTEQEIEIIDCTYAKEILLPSPTTLPLMEAANDDCAFGDAEIYSLDNARRAKHERSIERRASKGKLTDRRSAARVDANGETQLDRRAANRAANIQAIIGTSRNDSMHEDN